MKRTLLFAALLLVAGSLIASCSDTNKTIIGFLRPDRFPGSSVDSNNLADDRRAFTNNDQSITDGAICWDVDNNHAIVLLTTDDNSSGSTHLYATYFDGSRFTPPVEIHGENEDLFVGVTGFKAMFLDTAGLSNANARARNGDAIILFTRQDTDNPTITDDDANRRLYGTYFDVSVSSQAGIGTLQHGFDTLATEIDFDGVVTGAGNDEDVDTFGFVSDSLHGTHVFSSGNEDVDSGDPTTVVQIAWEKGESTGGTGVGTRYHFATFDMTQVGNGMPAQGSVSTNQLTPGAGSFDNGDNVDSGFIVHNQHMLWRVQNLGTTTTPDVVTDSIFSATTATQVLLGSTNTAFGGDSTDMPAARDVYGSDHGLTALYAFFTESGFTNDANGARDSDTDLMLAKIDASGTSRELQEIDAFTGTVNTTDSDADGFGVQDPADGADGSVSGNIDTRINRTGQYITVLWLQPNTNVSDFNDGTNLAGSDFPRMNDLLYGRVVQTMRDSTARSIANSASALLTCPSLVATGNIGVAGGAQADVNNNEFQTELVGGQSRSNGGSFVDLGCAFQSNRTRMNWTYQQLVDQAGADTDDTRLLVNGVDVTLDTTGTAAPTVALADSAVTTAPMPSGAQGLDTGWGFGLNPVAVDAGDANGDVLVFFFANDNNCSNNGAAGAFSEMRLYVADGTTLDTVSTDGTTNLNLATGTLRTITVPVNENIGSSPDWAGATVHVVWTELADTVSSEEQLAARSYNKNSTAALLADEFTTSLAVGPTFIDNPTMGDILSLMGPELLRNASTVGVYFDEDAHFYYNETSTDGDGYIVEGLISAPQLIDNDSVQNLNSTNVIIPPQCNDLVDSMALWQRFDGLDNFVFDLRMFIRVHN